MVPGYEMLRKRRKAAQKRMRAVWEGAGRLSPAKSGSKRTAGRGDAGGGQEWERSPLPECGRSMASGEDAVELDAWGCSVAVRQL